MYILFSLMLKVFAVIIRRQMTQLNYEKYKHGYIHYTAQLHKRRRATMLSVTDCKTISGVFNTKVQQYEVQFQQLNKV